MKRITPFFLKANAPNEVKYLQMSARRVAGYAVQSVENDFGLRSSSAPLRPPVVSGLTIREIAMAQLSGRMVVKRG